MENENKSELDAFLGDLRETGQSDPFNQNPEDPFAHLQETKQENVDDTKEEDVKAEEVKPLPFHKDPKIQKFIEREISKRISEIEIPAPQQKAEDTIDRRRLLENIIGNDSPEKVSAVEQLNKVFSDIEEKASKAEVLYEQRQEEFLAEQEADDALLSGIEAVEETYGVDLTSDTPQAKRERSRYIDSIRELAPKDKDGEIIEFPDFIGAYKYYQSTVKNSNPGTKAKELASRSTERGSSGENTKPVTRLSWDSEEWERFKESQR